MTTAHGNRTYRVVEGLLHCDSGIIVTGQCLDGAFHATVGQQDVIFHTPGWTAEDIPGSPRRRQEVFLTEPEWAHLQPFSPGVERPWDYIDSRGRVEDRWDSWGIPAVTHTSQDGTTVPTVAVINRLRYSASVSPGSANECDATASAIASSIDEWWSLTSSWIEIVASQEVVPTTGPTFDPARFFARRIWTRDDSGELQYLPQQRTSFERVEGRKTFVPITPELLQSCMTKASLLEHPPLEWTLIRDARALLDAEQTRRAVIDAGTAAELAITRLIDERLATTSEAVKDALLAKYRMLGQTSSLLLKLGGQLPRGFQQALIEPRNIATHAGTPPCKEVADLAVAAATEVVEQALPLAMLVPLGTLTTHPDAYAVWNGFSEHQ